MPHQKRMLRYMLDHPHAAVFAEMRTGKTAPTIRRLQLARAQRVLVIAPNSALGSWERELRLEGEDDVTFLQGPRKQRLERLLEGHRWNLINKEGWRSLPEIGGRKHCLACGGSGRDGDKVKCRACRGLGYVAASERLVTWDAIVIDESTTIKNPRAGVTKFFLPAFRSAAHRIVLTGIPNPESELDLWCQMSFLHGRAFRCGSYWQFRAAWFRPDEFGYDWTPKPGTREMMEGELARLAFRLRRRDARMPDNKVHETRRVEMPSALRKTYETAERDYVLEHEGERLGTTMYAGARWQWMRQMCGGFVNGKLVWKGKLDELVALLKGELARQQVVVWFAYNQEIKAAFDALTRARIKSAWMHGEVPPERRRELEAEFVSGAWRVFLVQQKIAEFGMDLSVADTAIVYSRHPALQTNVQSADRIVHPRKTWPLLYVDLVIPGSVDEDVANLVRHKHWRSQRLLDAAVWDKMKERARKCRR